MRATFSFLLCLVLIPSSVVATEQSDNKDQTALTAYLGLDFTEVTASAHRLRNSELLESSEMFTAYAKGAAVLPKYQDPVQTRGSRGVALFRSAAPAVTLVVVGNDQQIEGLGTGALVRSDGYVLTNWHVIAGHNGVVVFLKPSTSAELKDAAAVGARVIYQDSTADLAVLKLVHVSASGLPVIPVANMSAVQVAEDVHIIGHPHGELWSYSTGVISQIRNDYEWHYSDGSRHRAHVLQMQTAINPGNSGGPVLDDAGSMIGLVAMSEEGQNLDYAIAADVIQSFLRQAYAINSRGQGDFPQPTVDHSYRSKAANGNIVSKLVIGKSTIYWISTPQVEDAEVFIVDGHGNVVHGQRPNSAGGFSKWSLVKSGQAVSAKSEGRLPELFSLGG